ncbi:hypothetical protein LCGC14_2477840, partial [marine sediment metagenome]
SKLKQWITVGDDRVSQLICQPNEAGSGRGIPIDASFESGHVTTPGHPRCRCSVAFFGATRDQIEAGLTPQGRTEWIGGLSEGVLQVGRLRILKPPEIIGTRRVGVVGRPGVTRVVPIRRAGTAQIIDRPEVIKSAGITSEALRGVGAN